MNLNRVTIDGIVVNTQGNPTVLETALEAGIIIPTLCHLKNISTSSACRICIVEVGNGKIETACSFPVYDGMVVKTNTPKIRSMRKTILELIIANHNAECTTCVRSQNCELQDWARIYGIEDSKFMKRFSAQPVDESSYAVSRDPSKCIVCGRCVATCQTKQSVGALGFTHRSVDTHVSPPYGQSLSESVCIHCGQCITSCPVGALKEKSAIDAVLSAIDSPNKVVWVQTAPAVRVALGEVFGMPMGTSVTGKMVAALRRLGFDKVFDTDFAADVCIMEEGAELLERIKTGGVLPMITSCSPGWIQYAENFHEDLMPYISTCKSPQNMMGALLKNHFAQRQNIAPENVVVVSIMPCTAKKAEIERPEQMVDGIKDVDYSLTTRELGEMIKRAGIDFEYLSDEPFDPFFGESSGAGVIFGATGGVMEAAVRTLADLVSGKDIEKVDYMSLRGLEGVKSACIPVTEQLTLNVTVAHGGANIETVLQLLKSGALSDFHFIELMACPGGCVNGGGQPIVSAKTKMRIDAGVERAKALYREDSEVLPYRKSHLNPSVQLLYAHYLDHEKAHKLLHRK